VLQAEAHVTTADKASTHTSTVIMMHGPINIRYTGRCETKTVGKICVRRIKDTFFSFILCQ